MGNDIAEYYVVERNAAPISKPAALCNYPETSADQIDLFYLNLKRATFLPDGLSVKFRDGSIAIRDSHWKKPWAVSKRGYIYGD